ncbi:hypothetical protein AAFF_G00263140 [Aldrovandia affinis]|uniref:Uncharacterized protein n=1 Tax=Aldrovandia affinis TaxID=143900 RepID=A0AAD7WSS0_9TELE|nr:hypothetical protein AAFF_G00263140 [Aldrovandia affinis]
MWSSAMENDDALRTVAATATPSLGATELRARQADQPRPDSLFEATCWDPYIYTRRSHLEALWLEAGRPPSDPSPCTLLLWLQLQTDVSGTAPPPSHPTPSLPRGWNKGALKSRDDPPARTQQAPNLMGLEQPFEGDPVAGLSQAAVTPEVWILLSGAGAGAFRALVQGLHALLAVPACLSRRRSRKGSRDVPPVFHVGSWPSAPRERPRIPAPRPPGSGVRGHAVFTVYAPVLEPRVGRW